MSRPPAQPGLHDARHPQRRRLALALWATLWALMLAHSAAAQCTGQWLPGQGIRGIDGTVYAMTTWDPDGPGPLPEMIVAGGQFNVAGNVIARNIAMWNPVTHAWSPLGAGTNGTVYALAVQPGGGLVAAGPFTSAGGVPANHIAMFDGSTWSTFGAGVGEGVRALAVLPDGRVVAGGFLSLSPSPGVGWVSAWNGTWIDFGLPFSGAPNASGMVYSLAVASNGDLVAGGVFSAVGAQSVLNVARWAGTGWTPMGLGTNGTVYALLAMSNGDILAGGDFAAAGGGDAAGVARWNGSQWSGFGALPGGGSGVRALAIRSTGEIVIGGNFPGNVAVWNGGSWLGLGAGYAAVLSLAAPAGGDILAGGSFSYFPSVSDVGHVARWDGSAWSALPSIEVDRVGAMLARADGELFASVLHIGVSGVGRDGIARRVGNTWQYLGADTISASSMAAAPNGDLLAVSPYSESLRRWTGAEWTSIPAGQWSSISSVAVRPNGDILGAGSFYIPGLLWDAPIARLNGTTWVPVGSAPPLVTSPGPINMLAGGLPVVFGHTSVPEPGRIVRWTGTAWQQVFGITPLGSIATTPNGNLFAACSDFPDGVGRWDGVGWSLMGSGMAGAIRLMVGAPDNSVIVSRDLSSGNSQTVSHISRWKYSSWTQLGSEINATVSNLAVLPSGEVLASGSFTAIGDTVSAYFARFGSLRRCDADFDCSFSLDAHDLFDFLSAWFADELGADFNHDGNINAGDIYSFLGAWFAGCP